MIFAIFEDIKHPRKRAFLGAYALTGSIKFAAGEAQIKRATHYDWKAADAAYRAAFERAKLMAGDVLLDEAKRRAQKGRREYVLYKGKVVYHDGKPLTRRKYSDSMLMFLLTRLHETFRDRRDIPHSTPQAVALQVEASQALDLSGLTEEELSLLERLATKADLSRGTSHSGTQ